MRIYDPIMADRWIHRLLVFNGSAQQLEPFAELPFTNTDVIGVVLPGMKG